MTRHIVLRTTPNIFILLRMPRQRIRGEMSVCTGYQAVCYFYIKCRFYVRYGRARSSIQVCRTMVATPRATAAHTVDAGFRREDAFVYTLWRYYCRCAMSRGRRYASARPCLLTRFSQRRTAPGRAARCARARQEVTALRHSGERLLVHHHASPPMSP